MLRPGAVGAEGSLFGTGTSSCCQSGDRNATPTKSGLTFHKFRTHPTESIYGFPTIVATNESLGPGQMNELVGLGINHRVAWSEAFDRDRFQIEPYGYLLDATRYNRLWFDQGCERRWADLHCLLSQSIE